MSADRVRWETFSACSKLATAMSPRPPAAQHACRTLQRILAKARRDDAGGGLETSAVKRACSRSAAREPNGPATRGVSREQADGSARRGVARAMRVGNDQSRVGRKRLFREIERNRE